MRRLPLLTALLLLTALSTGCASTPRAATPGAPVTTVTDTPNTSATTPDTNAAAAASAGTDARASAGKRGRNTTADEYYRRVMARAARHNVKVTWVNGPRGTGYVRQVAYPNPLHFETAR